MRGAVFLVLVSGLGGCAARSPAPATDSITLRLTHPRVSGSAVLTSLRFSAGEVAANVHKEPGQLSRWLERLERQVDLDPSDERVVVRLPAGQQGDVLRLLMDTAGAGLDGLFGAAGVAEVSLELPRSGAVAGALTFPTYHAREACSGPRLVKHELVAPEVATGSDTGRHSLCVQLPRHYDDDPSRRFPVVLVFPGFSGLAAQNDGFGARGLFDSLGDATGVEVILVGVETRVAEGTRYLVPDGTGGDWIGYVTKRVLPWLDERFRTQPLRAAYGHSTGGWNALSLALAAPDVVEVAAASSPDPLDLDVWFLDGAAPRPRWWWWQRAEERLGGRGQFHSWATSWSAQGALPFDAGGALRPAVYGAWVRQSLATRVSTASLRLSGRLFLTAGTNDMFDLYAPTERFVELARARGLDVTWHPTALDHFGATEARFTPLVRFLLEKLKTARR